MFGEDGSVDVPSASYCREATPANGDRNNNLKNIAKNHTLRNDLKVNLILGMTPISGIDRTNHFAFMNLMESYKNFKCSYVTQKPSVHSKLYVWSKADVGVKAFLGSANYTQMAFFNNNQKELLTECDPLKARVYYDNLIDQTIYCDHIDVDTNIHIRNQTDIEKNQELEKVTVLLYSKQLNEVQNAGGLNWGQRSKREPNQAYIQLPPEVYKTDFFPKRSRQFTVLTDDNKSFICVRAQKTGEGHAIETTQNNSLLGEYFRRRLNIPNGQKVTLDDLKRYGRTNVEFTKIDDETYFLDFSK